MVYFSPGYTGPIGEPGIDGGVQWLNGPKGEKGARGETGLPGEIGERKFNWMYPCRMILPGVSSSSNDRNVFSYCAW